MCRTLVSITFFEKMKRKKTFMVYSGISLDLIVCHCIQIPLINFDNSMPNRETWKILAKHCFDKWVCSVVPLLWFEWNPLMYQNRSRRWCTAASHRLNPSLLSSYRNRNYMYDSLCLTRLRNGNIQRVGQRYRIPTEIHCGEPANSNGLFQKWKGYWTSMIAYIFLCLFLHKTWK